jgi:hypothetical protein
MLVIRYSKILNVLISPIGSYLVTISSEQPYTWLDVMNLNQPWGLKASDECLYKNVR